ncbi:MAG TPA: cytochrome c biogenesis protein CcsA [Bacteroidales bacterium]|nr:cytochrome c biogenesis protein CcsA [Bacteroidales bacterium]
MKKNWWKILCVVLILFSLVAGLLIPVPDLPIVHQSIRNLFFHVGMWFAMLVIFTISFIYSIRYLSDFKTDNDIVAQEASKVGVFFGILGIVTGMIWAKFTWGSWWVNDPKLNGAAVSLLVYFAYLVLRNSLNEEQKRAKVSAVYNIFAYVLLIVFIGILPRLAQGSIHPGDTSNPLTIGALDNNLRLVFYPAVVGWILLAVWILELKVKIYKLERKINSYD